MKNQYDKEMTKLYHWFTRLFKRKPQSIADRLTPAALAALQQEIAFLRGTHGVQVAALAENEEAGKPRPVGAGPTPSRKE